MPIVAQYRDGTYRVVDYPNKGDNYVTSTPVPQLLSWWTRRGGKCNKSRKRKAVKTPPESRKSSRTTPKTPPRVNTEVNLVPKNPVYTDQPNVYTIAKIHACRPTYTRKNGRWITNPNREYKVQFAGERKKDAIWVDEADIDPFSIEYFHSAEQERTQTMAYLRAHCGTNVDDKYKTSVIQRRGHKSEINEMFIASVLSMGGALGSVMVLDGEDANTTKRLLASGITETPIIAVNMSGSVANKITLQLPMGVLNVRVTGTTIYEAIKHAPSDSLSAVWLDYCSTWKGTDKCSPRNDLKLLFTNNSLRETSVVAITVCLRDARLRGDQAKYAVQIKSIRACITRRAALADYQLTWNTSYRYGIMYYASVTIRK